MAGVLKVSGMGKFLFPAEPRTIVRTRSLPGDTVHWLRSFAGRAFLSSTYRRSEMIQPAQVADDASLHDVESVWPLQFKFDWSTCTETTVLAPKHVGTSLLGLVPIPVPLVTVVLNMAMHEDGDGWDLIADVSALFGAICLIRYEGPMRSLVADGAAPSSAYVPGFHHLLLYDGACNLCNASVDFVLRNDAAERYIFVPQQSPAASEALRLAGKRNEICNEICNGGSAAGSVLLLTADGELHECSGAALRVGLALGWPWSPMAALAMLVPSVLRDAVYDWVGRNRYRMFGKRESFSRSPSASERKRFL